MRRLLMIPPARAFRFHFGAGDQEKVEKTAEILPAKGPGIIAKQALAKGIKWSLTAAAIFYHGRVAALAEAAREGLDF